MGSYAPASIGSSGLVIPNYQQILAFLLQNFQTIYGSTVYLGPDANDYQFIAILALTLANSNSGLQFTYLGFNPQTAIGANLDLLGKLMGTPRNRATFSTALLTVSGTPGTIINSGQVQDVNGNFWNLPSTVTIGSGGTVAVNATANIPGAVTANPATITLISTPTDGWTSVTNAGAAVSGQPVEPDSSYRARLQISQSKPSLTLRAGSAAAIAAVPGVTRSVVYENPNGYTASYGSVSTSGTAVTLLNGYPFDNSLTSPVTQSININGVVYPISSVTDATHLVIGSSAGTQTNVPFFIGDGIALGPAHSITAVVENGVSTAIAQAIYNNKNPGVLTNGTTAVVVTDPLNGNISMTISFDILTYVGIYVAYTVHALSAAFTTATQAAIQAAVSSYLDSLGIGETVVFSQLYFAALSVQPNQLEPIFSIRSILLGSQAAQTTADLNSSTTIVVTSSTGVQNGQTVVGAGIPPNTTVTDISGAPNIVISAAATITQTGVPVTFFDTGTADIEVPYNEASNSSSANVVVNTV